MKLQKIALFLFLLMTIATFCQTEKGSYLIGINTNINFNFDTNSIKGDSFSRDAGSLTEFTVSPEIGYAIENNFFIGLDFAFGYSDIEDKDFGYESTIHAISAAPFVKFYFSEKKIKPFLIASYGFGRSTDKTRFRLGTNELNTTKRKYSLLNLGGGLSYFFNKNINIELSLNYLKSSDTSKDESETYITNRFKSNLGFTIFI